MEFLGELKDFKMNAQPVGEKFELSFTTRDCSSSILDCNHDNYALPTLAYKEVQLFQSGCDESLDCLLKRRKKRV